MQLSRDDQPNLNLITGLDADGLRVRAEVYTDSLIVTADTVIPGWPVRDVGRLVAADWQAVVELAPQVVLLGSGRQLVFPATDVLAPLLTRGIGVEVMDTPAACRTYNLLLAEGRSVVAALILGDPEPRDNPG